jgi:hypothetical protein
MTRGVPNAEVVSYPGGGMAVEQHRHRFLLEFFGVDPPVRLGVLGGFHGTLRSCWIGVNLSSRSVHQTPYTSVCH